MSSLNNTSENDMRMITLKKNKLLVTHYFFIITGKQISGIACNQVQNTY